MANIEFSEKSNLDEHGLAHLTEHYASPELLLQRSRANICYSSKKAFFGGHLEIYSKKLCKTIMFYLLLLLALNEFQVSHLHIKYIITPDHSHPHCLLSSFLSSYCWSLPATQPVPFCICRLCI